MTSERTRVYLTFDVEGAEARTIRGVAWPPQGYEPRVWGRFANSRAELGLRFVLGELEAAGLAGTFFVETFGSQVFGRERLAEICREIKSRGHDVQLHAHPIQGAGREGESDQMADYDEETQVTLLREGIEVLVACGIPLGGVVGFRAGHFGADNRTWRAMGKVGLRVGSNYNPCYFHRCKIKTAAAAPGLFPGEDGVWELPITTFAETHGGHRHLQVTAISLLEMRHALVEARRLRMREVTIVAHPFEFFYIDSIPERRGRPNNVNRWRLRGLCRYLAEHRDDFEVETVGALAARIAPAPQNVAPGAVASPSLAGRRIFRMERLAEQVLKRLEASLPVGINLVRDRPETRIA